MTDQTPEARLAAALHTLLDRFSLKAWHPRNELLAQQIARDLPTADPALAADLALAAAVRGLDDAEDVTIIEYDPSITDYPWTVDIGRRHSDAATLTAAIEEALAAKEAERDA